MNSIIVFVAQYFLYFGLLVTAWFWFTCATPTKIELVVRLVIGGALALILAKIGSDLYYDPRPFVTDHTTPMFAHAPDNGFPSDHALLLSLLGWTVLGYSRKFGVALLAIALAVGVARVAARVHHPVDIVGSILFAAVGAAIALVITKNERVRSLWRQ